MVHYDEFFEGMELNIIDTNNKPINAEVYFSFDSVYSSNYLKEEVKPSSVGHYDIK
jgi:hypothetical protein